MSPVFGHGHKQSAFHVKFMGRISCQTQTKWRCFVELQFPRADSLALNGGVFKDDAGKIVWILDPECLDEFTRIPKWV